MKFLLVFIFVGHHSNKVMKNSTLCFILLSIIILVANCKLKGQSLILPANFPQFNINENNSPEEGYYFISAYPMPDKKPGWLMMIDSYGTPIYYRYFSSELSCFNLQPNRLLSFMKRGAEAKFYLMDSTFTAIDSLYAKTYVPNPHDFIALENGHFLFLADDVRVMDMSSYGGKTNALVTGCVVQEQDENKNVVFTWNSWDHFQITDSYTDLTVSSVDLTHHNSLDVDQNGNIYLGCRSLNEITKINRQTGEIIWRLGGKNNQFFFTDPSSTFSMCHDFKQLPNGNFTLFDNGNERNPPYSRALEYSIDQVNKVVDLAWSYDANKSLYADSSGSSTKLQNGNTLIGYGNSIGNPALLEVNPDSSIAFSIGFDSYSSPSAFKTNFQTTLFEPATHLIDFGEWDGYTEPVYLLAVKNNSTSVVKLTSYSTHTDAFRIDNSFPISIPANGQVILNVIYFPMNIHTGLVKDILTINSDINTSSLVQRISQQITLMGTQYDGTAPVASISLAGAENIPQDTIVYITFNEPTRWVNNTEFSYNNVDSLIVFKKDNASGENVPFDAVINTDKNKITIRTISLLSHTQTYYIAVADKFEDYSNKKGSAKSATFKTIDLTPPIGVITPSNGTINVDPASAIIIQYNEPIRNTNNSELTNSNISSLIALKVNDFNGANVSFTATINTEKTTITITPSVQLASWSTFYVAIGDVVEDFNNNKAAATSSSFTTRNGTIVPELLVNKVYVFPNPSLGLFNIQNINNKSFKLKVTDIKGRVVYEQTFRDVNSQSIDLSIYPDGIYLLNIYVDDSASGPIIKLIKQHE